MKSKIEIQRLENNLQEIKSEINKYYEVKTAIQILESEEELFDKCFKRIKPQETHYIKPISFVCKEAPFRVTCLIFAIPTFVTLTQREGGSNRTQFDYHVTPNSFIWEDTELVSELRDTSTERLTEITLEEYWEAYDTFCQNLKEALNKKFYLKDLKGERYEQEIKNNKAIQEET